MQARQRQDEVLEEKKAALIAAKKEQDQLHLQQEKLLRTYASMHR
jgi:hypothetical protein